jgi:hypothetical protein
VTPDYYALLEVAPEAGPEIIRAAYLVLAKRYHPDTAMAVSLRGDDRFPLIAEAYEVLSDPGRRAQYDRHHLRQRRLSAQREKFELASRQVSEQGRRTRARRAGGRPLVFAVVALAAMALMFGLVRVLAPQGVTSETDLAMRAEIDKAAQSQELAKLEQALQHAEWLATTYQDLLEQERTHRRELEQQLAAAHRDPASEPDARQAAATDTPGTGAPPENDKQNDGQNDKPATPTDDSAIAMAVRPAAPEAPANPEPARLMARAGRLLDQGNIGAARIVLERAAEMGSAPALFTLAQTYDPAVLSAWGTFGTQGDVDKAQELYAKAFAGGVRQAGDRLNSPP